MPTTRFTVCWKESEHPPPSPPGALVAQYDVGQVRRREKPSSGALPSRSTLTYFRPSSRTSRRAASPEEKPPRRRPRPPPSLDDAAFAASRSPPCPPPPPPPGGSVGGGVTPPLIGAATGRRVRVAEIVVGALLLAAMGRDGAARPADARGRERGGGDHFAEKGLRRGRSSSRPPRRGDLFCSWNKAISGRGFAAVVDFLFCVWLIYAGAAPLPTLLSRFSSPPSFPLLSLRREGIIGPVSLAPSLLPPPPPPRAPRSRRRGSPGRLVAVVVAPVRSTVQRAVVGPPGTRGRRQRRAKPSSMRSKPRRSGSGLSFYHFLCFVCFGCFGCFGVSNFLPTRLWDGEVGKK